MKVLEIKITDIKKTENYRLGAQEKDVSDLMASIKQVGLLNPVTVKKDGNKYKLIAGFRRYNAYKKLKLKTIPAHIRKSTAKNTTAVNLVENMQRENTSSYEIGRGIYQLMNKDSLTVKEVAVLLGLTKISCNQYLDLYKETPISFRDKVRASSIGGTKHRAKGFISNGTASSIINLKKRGTINARQKKELFELAAKDNTITASKVNSIARDIGAKSVKSELKNIKTFTVKFKMTERDFKKIGARHPEKIRKAVEKAYKIKTL